MKRNPFNCVYFHQWLCLNDDRPLDCKGRCKDFKPPWNTDEKIISDGDMGNGRAMDWLAEHVNESDALNWEYGINDLNEEE